MSTAGSAIATQHSGSGQWALVDGDGVRAYEGGMLRVAGFQHPPAVLSRWSQTKLASVGVYPLVEDSLPAGHEVVDSTLTFDAANSVVRRSFTTQPMSITALQERLVARVEARYAQQLAAGFSYDFGTATATKPDGTTEAAGVRTLQTRPHDRERWQTTMQVAQQYIVAGLPNEPMRAFRTADNVRVAMTAQSVTDCLNAMQAHFGALMEALWNHKDTIRTATDPAVLLSYDVEAGWG